MSGSLTRRLLLVSSLVLLLFLGLAGWSLDRAAEQRARAALEARLLGQIYALLGVAEENTLGLPRMPKQMSDPLLRQPDSGLYAQMRGTRDNYFWQSESMLGRQLTIVGKGIAGKPFYTQSDGLLLVNLIVEWEALDGDLYPYQIAVGYDLNAQALETATFRRVLWWWLGGAGSLLLIVQLLLLHWGLRPLSGLAADVAALEAGEQQQLSRAVPRELAGLRDNLNSLIQHNKLLIERNRNRLADLAHSLKTPLSVLVASVDGDDPQQLLEHARQQLPRMNQLVEYHLQRASVSGGGALVSMIDINAELAAILGALQKVHRQQAIEVQTDFPETFRMPMDKGDFYEMAGNLLENAFKYCRSCIRVSAISTNTGLVLVFENDGAGITNQQLARLLQRGERADQNVPGQGIGLSIVKEIVAAYDGRLEVERSDLGGARIRVSLVLPGTLSSG